MKISFFRSADDNQPEEHDVSWQELAEFLTQHEERETKDGLCWVPGVFDGTRAGKNLKSMCAFVFDLDNQDEAELARIAIRIEEKGYLYAGHTTHSATTEVACARLIIDAGGDRDVQELMQRRAALAELLQLEVDVKTNDKPRLYYAPSCRRDGSRAAFTGGNRPYWPAVVAAASPPKTDEQAVDLTGLVKWAKGIKDDARAKPMKEFIARTLALKSGERDSTIHALMSMLAMAEPLPPDEVIVKSLVDTMLARSEVEPEGAEHWRSKALYSYERGLAHRKKKDGAVLATRQALEKVTAPSAIKTVDGEPDWHEALKVKYDRQGMVCGFADCGLNVSLILEHDENYRDLIRMNVLTKEIEILGGPLQHSPAGSLDVALSNWLAGSSYDMQVPRHECIAQLLHSAAANEYDPVKQYLESLTWDSTSRAKKLLREYCGSMGDASFSEVLSEKFLISAVARVYEPGCKVDATLVMHGAQGVGKSRFVMALASPWSSTCSNDFTSKDSVMGLTRAWLVELPELSALHARTLEVAKAFLTRQSDPIRLPYARAVLDFPRRTVFIGTTNDDAPLFDMTGNRRFWMVSVRHCDYERIVKDRDQIWAEAVQLYKEGRPWHLDARDGALLEAENELYMADADPIDAQLLEWVSKKNKMPERVRTQDIATSMLQTPPDRIDNRVAVRIGKALRRLGFLRRRDGKGWYYETPKALLTAEVYKV